MKNKKQKTLNLGVWCTMAFLTANSAFAADNLDNLIGGDFGTNSDTVTDAYINTDYNYTKWSNDTTTEDFNAAGNSTWANVAVGAGSSYTLNAKTLTIKKSMYLYGTSDATATFIESGAATVTIDDDLILNYGTYNKSGSSYLTVNDEISMTNNSSFSTKAGSVITDDFTVGTQYAESDGSTVTLGGGTATGSLTVNDTMTLNSNAKVNTAAASDIANTTTIANLIMNDSSSYTMGTIGVLNIGTSLTMNNNASFQNTAGTLTFATGSKITINGGSFSSDTTTLNGTGTISLTLKSIDVNEGTTTEAEILGYLSLGTVTFGTDALWTIELNVGDLLDELNSDFEIALSEIVDIKDTDISNLEISLIDSDFYTASLSGTTILFSYGTAVPEPSTYAMIFGVVALGFAYYRRRK